MPGQIQLMVCANWRMDCASDFRMSGSRAVYSDMGKRLLQHTGAVRRWLEP